MNENNITIRYAVAQDIPALASLMTELGYPTTVAEMQQRFVQIQSHDDYATFVAVYQHEVVGMIGVFKNIYYEKNGIYARIAALVVNGAHRNKGIGKLLIQQAEKWAIEVGASALLLNSGNREERKVAHTFYQQQGFEPKTTGFVKALKEL